MFNKLRSIIFKLDPELAHNLAIKALKYNYIPNNKIPANRLIETEILVALYVIVAGGETEY